MSGLVILGDTSGSVTVNAPAVAGSTILSLPTKSGTISLSGPIFSAYVATPYSFNGTSAARVGFEAKSFDTSGCYNNTGSTVTLNGISTPAYSFAPNMSGYYMFTAAVGTIGGGNVNYNVYIVRNGNLNTPDYIDGRTFTVSGSTNYIFGPYSYIFYANGTTDTFSVYFDSGLNPTTIAGGTGGNDRTYFQATFLRSA